MVVGGHSGQWSRWSVVVSVMMVVARGGRCSFVVGWLVAMVVGGHGGK